MRIDSYRRHWFSVAALVLLAVAAGNMAQYGTSMLAWARGLFRQDLLVDAQQWQAWAEANTGFFAPLAEGTCMAVVRSSQEQAGTVLIKAADSIRAERAYLVGRRGCSAYLTMDEVTARRLLSTRLSQGNQFWDTWKQLARSGALRVYTLEAAEQLRANGVEVFLGTIDVRPGGRR